MDDLEATSNSNTPFAQLLLAVFNSILEVFLLCAAGYILARQGILDKRTQKQINRMNVSLFTPALLFSKVAFFLTPEKLKELWIIPIWFVIVTLASMAVGRVMGWLFGLRQSQRSFVMAAAMFMNSNALPIALMQSLVMSVPDLAWGSDDNKNAMLGRALTYLTMYSTLGMVVRYSYGVSLLSKADTILAAPSPTVTAPITIVTGTSTGFRIAAIEDTDEETPLLEPTSSSRPSTPPPHHQDYLGEETEELRTYPSAATLINIPMPYNSHPKPRHNRNEASGSGYDSSSPKLMDSPGRMSSAFPLPEVTSVANGDGVNNGNGEPVLLRPPIRMNTSFYNSFPNSPNETRANLPEWTEEGSSSSSHSESDDEVVLPSSSAGHDVESGAILPTHKHHRPRYHRQRSPTPGPPVTSLLLSSHPSKHPLFSKHTLHDLSHSHVSHTLRRVWTATYNFMTVPLWAALASLLVACINPLKHGLEQHLQPLNEAINMGGKCAVPLTLVVLGAYFCETTSEEKSGVGAIGREEDATSTASLGRKRKVKRTFMQRLKDLLHITSTAKKMQNKKEAKPRPGESKTVILAVASRMIITPLFLVPLMVVATSGDWHAVFEDPVFVTVNTLLLCSPPALTLAQITAAVSGDAFERLISRTIFWSYCVVTPPVMMASVLLGLWLAKF